MVISMLREQAIEKVDQLLPEMPFYIQEFVEMKTADEYSPNTLLEYLKNYHQFFQWLIDQKLVNDISVSNISIESLDSLQLRVATQYKSFLLRRRKQNSRQVKKDGTIKESKATLSKVTIQRNITALKVLFKYLSESSNNQQNKPYLTHNIMNEMSNVTDRQTLQARADMLEDKLFLDDETEKYLEFIRDIYPKTISKQAMKYYNRDKERDLAINALMLASGLRLSEIVSLNVDDVNFDQNRVYVVRKGDKTDSVRIAAFAMEYLASYLEIRDSRYHPDKYEASFFLSISKGAAKRITGSAIEKMVEKYSTQFRVRVTPHKLRHTLATRLYQQTGNLVLTAQQLGHSSTTTTTLYVHIDNDKTTDALNAL